MFSEKQFPFWVKYLKSISIFFAIMGVMWAVLGSFDPFGIWDKEFAKAFWDAEVLTSDVKKAKEFILAPFGATSAGYFILQYFIAKNAYAKRELWGFQAIVIAFFLWLILDSSMCFYHGAYFNILLANVPALIAMLPVFFTGKYFRK